MRVGWRQTTSWSGRAAIAFALLVAAPFPPLAAHADEALTDPDRLASQAIALLSEKCVLCHGDKKRESGLDMRSVAAMLKGGESGPALVAGDAEKSFLFERLAVGEMPPREDERLSGAEVALIRDWINRGGKAGRRYRCPRGRRSRRSQESLVAGPTGTAASATSGHARRDTGSQSDRCLRAGKISRVEPRARGARGSAHLGAAGQFRPDGPSPRTGARRAIRPGR